MEKTEFLEKYVFIDLKNLNEGEDAASVYHFSESDFEVVLNRTAKFGAGIYTIESWKEGAQYGIKTNEDYHKKATDAKWYRSAFSDLKRGEEALTFSATFRVSAKLLNKENFNF